MRDCVCLGCSWTWRTALPASENRHVSWWTAVISMVLINEGLPVWVAAEHEGLSCQHEERPQTAGSAAHLHSIPLPQGTVWECLFVDRFYVALFSALFFFIRKGSNFSILKAGSFSVCWVILQTKVKDNNNNNKPITTNRYREGKVDLMYSTFLLGSCHPL